jgi:hypothetical protein
MNAIVFTIRILLLGIGIALIGVAWFDPKADPVFYYTGGALIALLAFVLRVKRPDATAHSVTKVNRSLGSRTRE